MGLKKQINVKSFPWHSVFNGFNKGNFKEQKIKPDLKYNVIFMAVSNCCIFTVSNTTTFRLRMRLGEVNTVATVNEIFGDSNQAETSITFIKLGVI